MWRLVITDELIAFAVSCVSSQIKLIFR